MTRKKIIKKLEASKRKSLDHIEWFQPLGGGFPGSIAFERGVISGIDEALALIRDESR